MSQWVKTLATKTSDLSWFPGPTWLKNRTSCYKLVVLWLPHTCHGISTKKEKKEGGEKGGRERINKWLNVVVLKEISYLEIPKALTAKKSDLTPFLLVLFTCYLFCYDTESYNVASNSWYSASPSRVLELQAYTTIPRSLLVFKINVEYHNYFNIMASLIFLNKDT